MCIIFSVLHIIRFGYLIPAISPWEFAYLLACRSISLGKKDDLNYFKVEAGSVKLWY